MIFLKIKFFLSNFHKNNQSNSFLSLRSVKFGMKNEKDSSENQTNMFY